MMELFYRMLTRLVYWLVYPYGRIKAGRGSEVWRGRLGLIDGGAPVDLWLHASSVGEVKVVANLVAMLRQRCPGLRLHVTTMTTKGQETARDAFGDFAGVSYFPLDATPAVRRTLAALRPRIVIIAETEIWPNLVREAAPAVAIVLINGRMTEKALAGYRRATGLMRTTLERYDRLFFKSAEDASRFAGFGAGPPRGEVAGDMKFDTPLSERSEQDRSELRRRLGASGRDFVLVAGSTRSGEESLLLDLFERLRADGVPLRLVLAPRHVERSREIADLAAGRGLALSIYGDEGVQPIVLVDKMGLLGRLYLTADLAFVGGTLVDLGGHNLLEPVWAGAPVVFGPSVSNVRDAAEYIETNTYGARIESLSELEAVVREVATGAKRFRIKSMADAGASATATVTDYLVGKLGCG